VDVAGAVEEHVDALALGRKRQHAGLADALAGSGHQDVFAFEPLRHASSPFARRVQSPLRQLPDSPGCY
jgi:hypothetical protein